MVRKNLDVDSFYLVFILLCNFRGGGHLTPKGFKTLSGLAEVHLRTTGSLGGDPV